MEKRSQAAMISTKWHFDTTSKQRNLVTRQAKYLPCQQTKKKKPPEATNSGNLEESR